jgi:hypothetical protein
MKVLGSCFCFLLLLITPHVVGQTAPKIASSPTDFVPAGYIVSEKIQGDLNKDNQLDSVLIIKGTDKANVIKDEYRGELDRNGRGIIVAFKNKDHYELVLENRNCFSSENEDGGGYFAPELGVFVEKGVLGVHYFHGKYGSWAYKFRYQNSEFELIGFDSSNNRGPITESSVSINFTTKKIRLQENINLYAEDIEDEKLKTTWKKFILPKPITLTDITDFDEFNVQGKLRIIQ